MSISRAAIAFSVALLSGCEGPQPRKTEQASAGPSKPDVKPPEGYGDIKFESTFTQAINTVSSDLFNPASIVACYKDLPLYGCRLNRNTDGAPFEIKEGIPYQLTLSFNQFDKLTDIGLEYHREGGIKKAECLSIHERTLDWATREFGEFRSPQSREPGLEIRKTPLGRPYRVWLSEDGSFVTLPSRPFGGEFTTTVAKQPIVKWDGLRYASLLSTFIVVGEPICDVQVQLSEPLSVVRPKMKDEDRNMLEQIQRQSVKETAAKSRHDPVTTTDTKADATPMDDL